MHGALVLRFPVVFTWRHAIWRADSCHERQLKVEGRCDNSAVCRVCGVTGSSAARGRHISMTTPYTVRPTKRLKLFKLGIEKLPP